MTLALVLSLTLSFSSVLPAFAETPTPTLDKLHEAGVTMPDSTEVYPESAYKLEEINNADPENFPENAITLYEKTEVIKYYDPTTGQEVAESDRLPDVEYKEVITIQTTPKYYTVELKQTTYGDPNGDTTLNFGWEKNAKGNLEFKQNSTNPQGQAIEYKYSPSSFNETITKTIDNGTVTDPSGTTSSNPYLFNSGAGLNNPEGTTTSIDNVLYKDNKVTCTLESTISSYKYAEIKGGAVYNAGNISEITGAFINNGITANAIETAGSAYIYSYGGAIYNAENAEIGNITADFIGNYAKSENRYAEGGAIANAGGTIGDITGDFIGNYAKSENNNAYGGAINNNWYSTIGDITGDFIGNYAKSENNNAYGGAIYNVYDSTIGNITGDFIGNYATASSSANGGAIYNVRTIGDITGDFIGNYVSSSSSSYDANGGAIYNVYDSTIGNITGDFIGNYATASSSANGGAIYNVRTIGDITGDFIGNYVSSSSSSYDANGGAIYNYEGTIGDITGDFIGNYVSSSSSSANGGAICNKGTIGDITGDFIGNYATGDNNIIAGAISNYSEGTIGEINGDFIGNYVQSSFTGKGGAIYHYTASQNIVSVGYITGDFVGNYVLGGTGTAEGGAIYNHVSAGTISIGDIVGDFVGNYVNSSGDDAYGGAIYNSSSYSSNGQNHIVLGDITGDFIGNYATASSSAYGGAIYNYTENGDTNGNSTIGNISGDFVDNYVSADIASGGAIYNKTYYVKDFTGDVSTIGNITGNFINNHAQSLFDTTGGAIHNYYAQIGDITGDFIGNYASSAKGSAFGGAIYHECFSFDFDDTAVAPIGNITGNFIGNYTSALNESYGGAIYNKGGQIGYLSGNFMGNYAQSESSYAQGGAIFNNYGTIGDIRGDFIGNYASGNDYVYGGAIYNSGTIGNITGDFIGNYAKSENNYAFGGAIYNSGTIEDITGSFINNHATATGENSIAQGGAIWTSESLNIIAQDGGQSVFSGNYTESNGVKTPNAIYIAGATPSSSMETSIVSFDTEKIILEESNVSNDTMSTIMLNANTNGTIVFNDQIEGSHSNFVSNIYQINIIGMDENFSGKDEMYAALGLSADATVSDVVDAYFDFIVEQEFGDEGLPPEYADQIDVLKGSLLGSLIEIGAVETSDPDLISSDPKGSYNLKITGDSTGKVILNNDIINANISLDNTNLYLGRENVFDQSQSLSLNSGNLYLNNNSIGTMHIPTLNLNGNTNLSVDVDLANKQMDRITADNYNITNNDAFINVNNINLLSDSNQQSTSIPFADEQLANNVQYSGPSPIAYSPIYKYDVSYSTNPEDNLGYFFFNRSGSSSGNQSDAFNPAVLTPSVATQAGAYTTQLQTFNYAFQHADTFMNIPYLERVAIINQNKYALSPTGDATDVGTYSPLLVKEHTPGFWFKPYASFENIPLKNGPKVSNINYGSLIGYDSPITEISNGFERVLTGYIGYNGASQRYQGVDTYQNGGLLGSTITLYKGNFFNATTLSVGASSGDSTNMYGSENYAMLLAGIANKTGYNIEFLRGKLILQPNFLISYTFVNTFDYRNSAGLKIESDPLNAIQLSPGIKLIGNSKNGWQPYIGVNMVWNLLQDSKVTANDVRLPEMSIKPYVQYGVGLQKRFNEKFMAYGQAMIHNGGRNGVSFSAGFRWKVGKD